MGLLNVLTRRTNPIEAGFRQREPWVTQFQVGGRTYGGKVSFEGDMRVRRLFEAFPNIKSILELGSLEGGQTFEMTKRPGVSVLGLEGRDYNIEKAQFAQKALKVKHARFVQANLEDQPLSAYGHFDAVFCSGLLYHLPRPWDLIDRFRAAAPRVLLCTHYATEEMATEVYDGFPGCWHNEYGVADPLSGLSPKSFWITIPSMVDRLKQSGYENVEVVNVEQNANGPHVILSAWSGSR